MVEEKYNMGTESFYEGNVYSMEPKYGELFTGYQVSPESLGLATDPRTANVVKEVSGKLNTGATTAEVQALQPEIFDSMPKQELEELNRLAKITGAELTIHGPMVEASGYNMQSQSWSEAAREDNERQIKDAMERSHIINPKGCPVTFHTTWQIPELKETTKGEDGEKIRSTVIVNPETGRLHVLKEEERYFPEEEGQIPGQVKEFNPEKELNKVNQDMWAREVDNLTFHASRGNEYIDNPNVQLIKDSKQYKQIKKGKITPEEAWQGQEFQKYKHIYDQMEYGEVYLENAYRELQGLYDNAYKDAKESNDIRKIEELNKFAQKVINNKEALDEKDPQAISKIVREGVGILKNMTPQTYKPMEEFIVDKDAETFANVALHSYNKYGNNAPIVSIENPPAGGGLSRAEDVKKVIEETRKRFVQKAVEEGMGKSEAKNAAEKMIGATWDVGHINMLRKKGFSEKDIIKETEKIAPYVKHVHLSDNFGFEHTELPMGMGNVPIKDIMKKLGEKGFEGKKIIEAMHWYQHFDAQGQGAGSAFGPTVEAFGSPIYGMQMSPYWFNSTGITGGYSSGYGMMLPEQHFSVYGSGFASLPAELGGQMQGGKSRLSGTPNA